MKPQGGYVAATENSRTCCLRQSAVRAHEAVGLGSGDVIVAKQDSITAQTAFISILKEYSLVWSSTSTVFGSAFVDRSNHLRH